MTAHRVNRRARKENLKKARKTIRILIFSFLALLFLGFFVFFLFIFFKFERTSLVYKDENYYYLILDPQKNQMINIIIPEDLLVDAALGYGRVRLGKLEKLSKDEGLDMKLVTKTISRYLYLPTIYWGNESASFFNNKSLIKGLSFVFNPNSSNMGFIKKLQSFLFTFKIKSNQRLNYNLSKTDFLSQKVLQDGEPGHFKQMDVLPSEIKVFVVDSMIKKNGFKVEIVNKTGDITLSNEIKNVLESMGFRVLSVLNKPKENTDCLLYSTNQDILNYASMILDCKGEYGEDLRNFDLILEIGEIYLDKF